MPSLDSARDALLRIARLHSQLAIEYANLAAFTVPAPEPVEILEDALVTVQRAVCTHYRISPETLKVISRARHHVEYKMAAVLLARLYTQASYPQIGQWLKQDHSTIIATHRKAEARYNKGTAFIASMSALKATLGVTTPTPKELPNGPSTPTPEAKAPYKPQEQPSPKPAEPTTLAAKTSEIERARREAEAAFTRAKQAANQSSRSPQKGSPLGKRDR